MKNANAGTVHVSLKVDGIEQTLLVDEFNGVEGISRLFEFNLFMFSDSARAIRLSDAVGKPARLAIYGQHDVRFILGIISYFLRVGTEGDGSTYQATLVPRAWRLMHRSDCRVFQKQSSVKIIGRILKDHGVEHEFLLKGNQHPPDREYCIQYQESDWSFICRLMEAEGFYFYFHQDSEHHVMQICNDRSYQEKIANPAVVPFRHRDSGNSAAEHIFSFNLGQSVRPTGVILQDYHHLQPTLDLERSKKVSGDHRLMIYDYPGGYQEARAGQRLADIRLQEALALELHGSGQSICPRLVAGYIFELNEPHRHSPQHKKYLITEVQHWGSTSHREDLKSPETLEVSPQGILSSGFSPVGSSSRAGHHHGSVKSMAQGRGLRDQRGQTQPNLFDSRSAPPRAFGKSETRCQYENTFCCIPSSTQYRPLRATPHPKIHGIQSAVVVGPDTEEIYVDELGRIKVQFHWDRLGRGDERSSCWIRVAQGVAGQGWGGLWIPRINQEVLVSFLEGDPDRPIIVGAVYHGKNIPPLSLPAEKTRTTFKTCSTPGGGGSNEIRFEDKKGEEEVYLHSQKDLLVRVEEDMSSSVGSNQTLSIAGSRSHRVGGKEIIRIGASRRNPKDARDQDRTSDTYSVEVEGDAGEVIHGKKEVRTHAGYIVQVGGDLIQRVGRRKTIKIEEELEIKVGSSKIVMEKSGRITIEGTEIRLGSSGEIIINGSVIRLN